MSEPENNIDHRQHGPMVPGNQREVESINPIRTDIDLIVRIYFHPVAWLNNWWYWDEWNGYGFKLGPIMIKIAVTKFINIKFKK